jgi:hypothetical protein
MACDNVAPRTMRRRPLLLPISLFAAIGLAPATAGAFERQWHAGASFGYALLGTTADAWSGYGGALHLTYGLSDSFNALAQIDVVHEPGGKVMIASGSLGAAYVLDVLRWVPYVGAMAGGYDLFTVSGPCGKAPGDSCHAARLGLSVPAGLDYQVSRSFAIGVQVRYHLLLLGDPPAHLLTTFARAEYVWGW